MTAFPQSLVEIHQVIETPKQYLIQIPILQRNKKGGSPKDFISQ